MKKLSVLMLLVGIMIFSSCKTELLNCVREIGDKEWREISVESFKSVTFRNDVKVTFKQGEQNVMVYSTPNVINAIEENSTVSDENWVVKVADCSYASTVEYVITLPTIEGISVSGKGEIYTEGTFSNLDMLDLNVSGDGYFEMAFDTIQHLNMTTSGDGTYKMAGFAEYATVNISGKGTVENFDLTATTCDIDINGDGDCQVTVTDNLNVKFSGAGSVCYKGNPIIDTDISGAGSVNNCN